MQPIQELVIHRLRDEYAEGFQKFVEKRDVKWEKLENNQYKLTFPEGTTAERIDRLLGIYVYYRIFLKDRTCLFWFVHKKGKWNSISIPGVY